MRRLWIGVLPLVLVTACGPSDPYSGLWLSRANDQLLLHYDGCSAGDKITEVVVSRPGHEDAPLWRERSAGSSLTAIPLGQPATGFSSTKPVQFPDDSDLIVSVRTTLRDPGGLEFKPSKIRPGQVLWDRGSITADNPYASIKPGDRGC